MTSSEAIREMLRQTRTSQARLSEAMGSESHNTNSIVSSMLRSDVRVQTLARVANILGYRLILVDGRGGETIELTYDPNYVSGRSSKAGESK